MAITFVELDEGVVDRLKNTAVFHDIQLPWDQETLHSKLEELGASMQSSLLCQKILLHKNSFDDILSMSTTAMSLFDLTTPPRLCGLLYGAISVSSTASTPDIFSSVLDKIRQCNLGCAKLSAHYKEIPMPGRMSLQEAQTRFAATYEVIIEFLGLLISKFDYRPIREETSSAWMEIVETHKRCMNGIKETCEMLDQARTEVLAGAPSSAISLRSLSGFHHAHTIDTTPSSLYILPKKPAKFYARAEEIERLQRGLHEYHSICISGTGGVGKTSLALHFAYRSFSHYRFMFHIRSDSELSINQDFTKIAMKLGLPGVNKEQYMANRELVLDWLQSTTSGWLLIFDEADNGDLTEDMWPTNPNGAIIVTTRLESVGFVFCDDQMRLDPFSTEEGANYVLHLASLASGVPADIESARLLSDELGGLPLGINQMTALMRTQKTSLDKFLKLYRDDKHSYHLRHAAKSGKHLSTTWLVTFNALQKSPNCRSLLGILSLLEHTGVPEELFNHWSITKPRTTSDVLSFCKVENDFVQVEAELLDRALIDKDASSGVLSMHKVVQVEFEYFIGHQERQASFDVATKFLHDILPMKYTGSRFDDEARSQYFIYIQHVVALNDRYLKPPKDLPHYIASRDFAELTSHCAWFLFEISDFANLQRLVEGGIKACEDRQGPGRDDVTYAYLHHILGTADSSTGNFRRAEKALKFALRIWEGCSGAHLDEITSTLNNLGIVYNTLGQYDKAEEQFSTARRLLLDSKGEGADDQDQIQSIRMFEHNLQRLAIHRKPETVKKEELESMIEFFLVRGNWYIGAHCWMILGSFFQATGDYHSSMHAFKQARITLDGPERAGKQPESAMMIYKLGFVTFLDKKYPEAEQHFQDSLKISKLQPNILGDQVRTLVMLAKTQRLMPHKSKEGEKSMSEAKKLLQRMQASCDDFYSVDLEDDSSVNTLVCALYW